MYMQNDNIIISVLHNWVFMTQHTKLIDTIAPYLKNTYII